MGMYFMLYFAFVDILMAMIYHHVHAITLHPCIAIMLRTSICVLVNKICFYKLTDFRF